MVRTINTSRTLAKGQRSVLLPGSTEAEPWEVWAVGADARCLEMCRTPEEAKTNGVVLALPLAQVYCLPLWLQETDPKLFPGMIELQLEARGLQPRSQPARFNWEVAVTEAERVLVVVAVLPANLPPELETNAPTAFDLSARCFALPTDALVLWRERDRLALALTRGSQLVYFQALSEGVLSPRLVQDILCLAATLQMQDVLGQLARIVSWVEGEPLDLAPLSAALGAPAMAESRPAPALPKVLWNLTPARVGEAQRMRQARRWQGRTLALVALAVVLVALGYGGRVLWTSYEVGRLQAWQTAHAPALKSIHDTRAAWQDLAPVVDRNGYPLEVLRNVSNLIPVDQLHLTLFELDHGHLLLKAEAKNLTAAFQFFDRLKKEPALRQFTWEMAQPHSLANDVTQLQIEGTHAGDN